MHWFLPEVRATTLPDFFTLTCRHCPAHFPLWTCIKSKSKYHKSKNKTYALDSNSPIQSQKQCNTWFLCHLCIPNMILPYLTSEVLPTHIYVLGISHLYIQPFNKCLLKPTLWKALTSAPGIHRFKRQSLVFQTVKFSKPMFGVMKGKNDFYYPKKVCPEQFLPINSARWKYWMVIKGATLCTTSEA